MFSTDFNPGDIVTIDVKWSVFYGSEAKVLGRGEFGNVKVAIEGLEPGTTSVGWYEPNELKRRFAARDPENMCPYGAQNHPLPEPKQKYMTTAQMKEVTNGYGI